MSLFFTRKYPLPTGRGLLYVLMKSLMELTKPPSEHLFDRCHNAYSHPDARRHDATRRSHVLSHARWKPRHGWFTDPGSDADHWQLTHEAWACGVASGQSDSQVSSS